MDMAALNPLVREAYEFAAWAHGAIGQIRKYTENEPYITHPVAVAKIVMTVQHTPEMVAAALLHDTREDVNVPRFVILRTFGPVVDEYVDWLSDISSPADGNRAARKAKDRDRLALAPSQVQTIKLADLIHNSSSILEHDEKFARVYLGEKSALLNVLTKGDPSLHALATDVLRQGLDKLGMDFVRSV